MHLGPPLPLQPGSTHLQPAARIVYIFEPGAKVLRHKQETGSLACAPFSGAFTYYKALPPLAFLLVAFLRPFQRHRVGGWGVFSVTL